MDGKRVRKRSLCLLLFLLLDGHGDILGLLLAIPLVNVWLHESINGRSEPGHDKDGEHEADWHQEPIESKCEGPQTALVGQRHDIWTITPFGQQSRNIQIRRGQESVNAKECNPRQGLRDNDPCNPILGR